MWVFARDEVLLTAAVVVAPDDVHRLHLERLPHPDLDSTVVGLGIRRTCFDFCVCAILVPMQPDGSPRVTPRALAFGRIES